MASKWEGLDGLVATAVEDQSRTALGTYRHEPRRMGQDANLERSIAEGAYAKRQLFELIQNAADAMRKEPGRCEVVLTSGSLYVANSGEPFTADGVVALMGTHDSVKRDDQIGGSASASSRSWRCRTTQGCSVVRDSSPSTSESRNVSWRPSCRAFRTIR